MDSTWVDTSLELNTNSFRHGEAVPVSWKKPTLSNSQTEESAGSHVYGFAQKRDSSGDTDTLRNGPPFKQEASDGLLEEFNRISSENKRLTEKLKTMFERCKALQSHLDDLKSKNTESQIAASRKRKHGTDDYYFNGCNGANLKTECSSSDEESPKRPMESSSKSKISRVCVRADASDMSLVVKDGYQWRKYGQKVTRDNPSPRAYFKCSFAPGCPVKKKVQRSAEDPSLLVATYEGEHNHAPSSRAEMPVASISLSPNGVNPIPVSAHCKSSSSHSVTLDLVQSGTCSPTKKPTQLKTDEQSSIQQFLVQKMASSLTSDPNFTAALAAAISGRVLEHRVRRKHSET